MLVQQHQFHLPASREEGSVQLLLHHQLQHHRPPSSNEYADVSLPHRPLHQTANVGCASAANRQPRPPGQLHGGKSSAFQAPNATPPTAPPPYARQLPAQGAGHVCPPAGHQHHVLTFASPGYPAGSGTGPSGHGGHPTFTFTPSPPAPPAGGSGSGPAGWPHGPSGGSGPIPPAGGSGPGPAGWPYHPSGGLAPAHAAPPHLAKITATRRRQRLGMATHRALVTLQCRHLATRRRRRLRPKRR
jgi:hypothetical protein